MVLQTPNYDEVFLLYLGVMFADSSALHNV